MAQDAEIVRGNKTVRADLINVTAAVGMDDDLVAPAQVAKVHKRTRSAVRQVDVAGEHTVASPGGEDFR